MCNDDGRRQLPRRVLRGELQREWVQAVRARGPDPADLPAGARRRLHASVHAGQIGLLQVCLPNSDFIRFLT